MNQEKRNPFLNSPLSKYFFFQTEEFWKFWKRRKLIIRRQFFKNPDKRLQIRPVVLALWISTTVIFMQYIISKKNWSPLWVNNFLYPNVVIVQGFNSFKSFSNKKPSPSNLIFNPTNFWFCAANKIRNIYKIAVCSHNFLQWCIFWFITIAPKISWGNEKSNEIWKMNESMQFRCYYCVKCIAV